jgi:hypothetical protein
MARRAWGAFSLHSVEMPVSPGSSERCTSGIAGSCCCGVVRDGVVGIVSTPSRCKAWDVEDVQNVGRCGQDLSPSLGDDCLSLPCFGLALLQIKVVRVKQK